MSWQKRQQMRCHSNRTDPWPTTTVRNAEGLVQIQMADISPKGARPAKPHLRIQVGTVEIHLPSMLMNKRTDFANPHLKHAVR